MYAISAYIDPENHRNVGIYGSPMEYLGLGSDFARSVGSFAALAQLQCTAVYSVPVVFLTPPCLH